MDLNRMAVNILIKKYPFFLENDSSKLVHPEPEDESFRVAVIEHDPKLLAGFTGVKKKELLYIATDIDNTLLIDVPYAEYSKNRGVQLIRYSPSQHVIDKYKERLANPDPNKVVHYRFINNNTIESAVVVRPAYIRFLRQLKFLLESNRIKILAISANDYPRTQAILNQLIIDGKSLSQWGFVAVDPKDFTSDGKNLDLLRQRKNITDIDTIVVLDDVENAVSGSRISEGHDIVFGVPPWESPFSKKFLDGEDISEFELKDSFHFARIIQVISQLQFNYRLNSISERIRSFAQLALASGVQSAFELSIDQKEFPKSNINQPGKLNSALQQVDFDFQFDETSILEISSEEMADLKSRDQTLRLEVIEQWQKEFSLFINTLPEITDDQRGEASPNLLKILNWIKLKEGFNSSLLASQLFNSLKNKSNFKKPIIENSVNSSELKREELWISVLSLTQTLISRKILKPFDLMIILSRIDQSTRPTSTLMKMILQLDNKSNLINYLLRDPNLIVTKTLLWARTAMKIELKRTDTNLSQKPIPSFEKMGQTRANLLNRFRSDSKKKKEIDGDDIKSLEERLVHCQNLF